MPVTIDYYLSLNSPWTYMGSALFADIAKRNGATINVKPAKFGPILSRPAACLCQNVPRNVRLTE